MMIQLPHTDTSAASTDARGYTVIVLDAETQEMVLFFSARIAAFCCSLRVSKLDIADSFRATRLGAFILVSCVNYHVWRRRTRGGTW
jgi:hypothetical protein